MFTKLNQFTSVVLILLIISSGYQTFKANSYRTQFYELKTLQEESKKQREQLIEQVNYTNRSIERYQEQQKELIEKLQLKQQQNEQLQRQASEILNDEKHKNWSNQPVPNGVAELLNQSKN